MFVSFVANLFLQILVFHLLPDQFCDRLMISCSRYPHTSLFGKECGSSREMWGLDSYYLSMMISCWDYPHETTLFGKGCVSSREMQGFGFMLLQELLDIETKFHWKLNKIRTNFFLGEFGWALGIVGKPWMSRINKWRWFHKCFYLRYGRYIFE
jgi:hypothetical protein